MVVQTNPNKTRLAVNMDWETAAKLYTFIKGRSMPAFEFKGRGLRKNRRSLSVSYFVEQMIKERLADVNPDAESVKWMVQGRNRALKKRAANDEKVRNGANRKPKSSWKKPGRVPGKIYPKYEKAIKRIAKGTHSASEKVN